MIPAQELSLDPIPLFDAALWELPGVESESISLRSSNLCASGLREKLFA
jgi:hypothetical protein